MHKRCSPVAREIPENFNKRYKLEMFIRDAYKNPYLTLNNKLAIPTVTVFYASDVYTGF